MAKIEEKRPVFVMMIGLPASGKSTLARKLSEEKKYLHISSDEIRKELFGSEKSQEDNVKVFDEMRKRTITALKNGQSVVYDATNTSSKRRRGFLKQLPKGVRKECIYMATDYLECLERGDKRERKVPLSVMMKMFINLQVPMWHEGWDDIKIQYTNQIRHKLPTDIREISLSTYERFLKSEPMFRQNIDLAQDSSYHTLSVHRHMYRAFEEAKRLGVEDDIMLFACLFHDLGKCWTKCYKEGSIYANFYGHENVSAQLVIGLVLGLGFSEQWAIKLGTLVQLHTKIMQLIKLSNRGQKLRDLENEVGTEMYDYLLGLYTYDKNGI